MGRTGQYSKSRRRITEPVLEVPPDVSLAKAPIVLADEMVEEVQEVTKQTVTSLDKNRLILRKTTGWLMATLVVTALGAASYLGSKFFTREAQLEHLMSQVHSMKTELEIAEDERQFLEKRIVTLETELEALKEKQK